MQYFDSDVLYRSAESRKVGPDELFLDLVIVGGVAALGHELRESFKGWPDIEKFFLLFTALYSSWRSIVLLWNLFDVKKDLIDKFGIYSVFLSLTGIALGAHGAFEDGIREYVAAFSFTATAIPSATMFFWSFREKLLRNPKNITNQLSFMALVNILCVVPYLAAAFVSSSRAARALYWTSYGLQTVSIFFTGSFYRFLHRNRPGYTRLAIAIELFVEKYEILTMIVLGESVLGILFETALFITKDDARVGALYGAAAAGTAMLYAFQTYYVNIDGDIARGGRHAIRYKANHGIFWGQLHTWFHMALILFATGLGFAIRDVAIKPTASSRMLNVVMRAEAGDVEPGSVRFGSAERWVFSAGWGAALLLSGIIALLHDGGRRAATKKWRIGVRMIVAIGVMVGMPFTDVSADVFLYVYTAVLIPMVLVEFICVHMDRMGFFKVEDSSLESSDMYKSSDSFTDDEDDDTEEEQQSGGEGMEKTEVENELRRRTIKKGCNRFVVCEAYKREKERKQALAQENGEAQAVEQA